MSQISLHFKMAQDVLARLVVQAAKATPKKSKPNFEALNYLLLEASYQDEEALLRVTGYNGEFAIEVTSHQLEIVQEGKVLLPALSLGQLIASLPAKQIVELKVEEREEAVIVCGSSLNTLKGYHSVSDFPLVVSELAESPSPVLMMTETFRKTISQVTFAASQDENARNTHSVCLRFGEKEAAITSTDGIRLALIQIPVVYTRPASYKPFQVLVAADTLEVLRGLLDESEYGQIEVGPSKKGTMLIIKSGGCEKFRLTASVVEGAFPEYQKIIPTHFRTRVIVGVEELITASKIASICLKNTRDNAYKWNFWLTVKGHQGADDGSGTLTVGSSSVEGSSLTPLAVLTEGEPNQLALQPEKFLDILKVLEAKRVVLEMVDNTRPLVIKPYEYEAGEKWLFLQVPVNSAVPQTAGLKKENSKPRPKPPAEGQLEEINPVMDESMAEGSNGAGDEMIVGKVKEAAGKTAIPVELGSDTKIPVDIERSQKNALLTLPFGRAEMEAEEDTLD